MKPNRVDISDDSRIRTLAMAYASRPLPTVTEMLHQHDGDIVADQSTELHFKILVSLTLVTWSVSGIYMRPMRPVCARPEPTQEHENLPRG